MSPFAVNVRRLMARSGLTIAQLVESTGLHHRTLKRILSGTSKPHPRTLHRLARGLGVETDELFEAPSPLASGVFDRNGQPVSDASLATLKKAAEVLETQRGALLSDLVEMLHQVAMR